MVGAPATVAMGWFACGSPPARSITADALIQ